MILGFYRLAEQPFGVTPDPRFLYFSPNHREALASMLYGVSAGRGFTALIAQPGMGKTTLLFDFLDMLKNNAKTAFLFQPQCSPQDLLRSLLFDLGVEEEGTDFVGLHRKLIDCLLNESKQGRQLVVVVDEAQNLDEPVLELLRMLSNFETPREKLMHLVLVGQPQLAEKLASPRLIQLRQRISIIARLEPLSVQETQLYIDHRLRVAGYDFVRPLFTKQTYAMIADHAEGIPRNINNLCFNAMSLGCAVKQRTIDVDVIKEVIGDLDVRPLYAKADRSPQVEEPMAVCPGASSSASPRTSSRAWALRFALAVILMALIGGLFIRTSRPIDRVPAYASPSSRSETSTHTTQERSIHPVVSTEVRSAPSMPIIPAASTSPVSGSKLVQVLPDQTVYQIIIENFGRYDVPTLAKIRELNPWLTSPRRIKSGQTIVIPGGNDRLPNTVPIGARVPAAVGAGAEKP